MLRQIFQTTENEKAELWVISGFHISDVKK
jgi:hypothetical protein